MYNLFQLWTLFFSRRLCCCATHFFLEMGERETGKTALSLPLLFFLPEPMQRPVTIDCYPTELQGVPPSNRPFTYTYPVDILRDVASTARSLLAPPPLFSSLWAFLASFLYPTPPNRLDSDPNSERPDHARAMLCFTVYDVRPMFPLHIELRLSPGSPSVSFRL